jgi:hypothetical protein
LARERSLPGLSWRFQTDLLRGMPRSPWKCPVQVPTMTPKYGKTRRSLKRLQLRCYKACSVYLRMQWSRCISLHLNGTTIRRLWSHMCRASVPGLHSAYHCKHHENVNSTPGERCRAGHLK